MPLPAAALLGALATAARVGGRAAIRGGTKLFRGTAKVVKNPKKFSKRSFLMAKGQVNTAVSETKRHANFYKKVVSPHGSQFKHLIKRPTFGETRPRFSSEFANLGIKNEYIKMNTKGKRTRSKLAKAGIYGGYIGAYKLFGDD